MSKKRDQINRRRQLSKTRQGSKQAQRIKPGKPPVRKEEEKSQMSDIWLAVGIVALIVAAFVALYYFAVRRPAQEVQTPTIAATVTAEGEDDMEKVLSWSEPPEMALDSSKDYEAVLTTEKGDVRIALYAKQVPVTVNNFCFLSRQGFYDGVTFHRVLEGFMAQTGDPTGTGSGGPGYSFEDEFVASLRHDSEGIVSMANAGPGTNGSQFFILYAPQPHLDDHHSVFGKVIEGMDVVNALTLRDPSRAPDAPPGDKILAIESIEK